MFLLLADDKTLDFVDMNKINISLLIFSCLLKLREDDFAIYIVYLQQILRSLMLTFDFCFEYICKI